MRTISFTLNGKPASVTTDDTRMLLWVLRDDLGLTGTKYGCGQGFCGSCAVAIDNAPARSCSTRLSAVDGKHVTTIEGLEQNGTLHPVQEAFLEHAGYQCGFCTPGMIMGIYTAFASNPDATPDDVIRGPLETHLCRCGAHPRIVDAVKAAHAALKGGAR
jgi:aerobic-type carbon monoxide dehydrogenase small subunit (CoxS/CutS family)